MSYNTKVTLWVLGILAWAFMVLGSAVGMANSADATQRYAPKTKAIPAVVAETKRSGWPHPRTQREEIGMVRESLRYFSVNVPPNYLITVRCQWVGVKVSPARCSLRYVNNNNGKTILATRFRMYVFEDGSWTPIKP